MSPPVAYGRVLATDEEDLQSADDHERPPGMRIEVAAVGDREEFQPQHKPRPLGTPAKTSPGDLVVPLIGVSVKWLVLVFLVFQNCVLMLLMRYTRAGGAPPWSAQSGVIMQEVMKGVMSLYLILREEGSLRNTFMDPVEMLKTGVPAVLYLLQNNMLYVAASRLDAPTMAVMAQLKVLTTALFSVTVLGRSLSKGQWLALVVLAIGVSIVTTSQAESARHSQELSSKAGNPLVGVAAMLLVAVTSGVASVYFEKTLKSSRVSMWGRNLQMALYSVVIGGLGLLGGSERELVYERGFFGGYNFAVWATITNNAVGGLLVAMAITYADSIMKNWSTSIAIVLTAILSAVLFGTVVGQMFGLGVALVIYAVMLYGGVVSTPTCSCSASQPAQLL